MIESINKGNKIAILTQPLGQNYGGIIQNYALQKVLKNIGHESITLDIRQDCDYFGNYYSHISSFKKRYYLLLNETKHRLEGRRRVIPSGYYFDYIHKNTINFIKQHISISPTLYSTQSVKKYFNSNNFNNVVVGSDQVWRPIYSPNIYNFFLDFTENKDTIKRISYAASFGTSNWEFSNEETLKCKELINQFDHISVREIGGIDLCDRYLESSATCVLDPTLLLNSNDYIELFDDMKIKRKGIFSYILDKADFKNDIISQLEQFLGCKSFYNQPKKYFYEDKKSSPEDYQIPKLENWIKAFYEAEFIVTDSFHGTVFSIIFNKPFLVLINESRGADRFNSLLGQIGLEDRIYDVNKDLSYYIKNSIDYKVVDEKLCLLKEYSFKFLKDSLKS